MSLIDLKSDLSKFRSEVSTVPKNTPEASKATDSKNFATFQPITEKLSKFSVPIQTTSPNSNNLENRVSKFSSSETVKQPQGVDTPPIPSNSIVSKENVKKFLEDNLILNKVSRYSIIEERLTTKNLDSISTSQVESKFTANPQNTRVNISSEFILEQTTPLSKTDTVKIEQGTYNTTDQSKFSLQTKKSSFNTLPKLESIDIPTEINTSKKNQENNSLIQVPNIEINKSTLSFDKKSQSPSVNFKQGGNSTPEYENNIQNPNIQVEKIPQVLDRSSTSPDINKNSNEFIGNITSSNIDIIRKPLSFEKNSQIPNTVLKISKDEDSVLDNITVPNIALNRIEIFSDKSEQSPNINKDFSDSIIDPDLDIIKSNLNSKQLEDNSGLNLDEIVKLNPSGRNEDPDKSKLSMPEIQEVNFFSDLNAKGFKSRINQGKTYYQNNSKYAWLGNSGAAPGTNFITDINGKGFLTFAGGKGTQFKTNSSIFGFDVINEVDFFDKTKTYTNKGFTSFIKQFDTFYKPDSSNLTFKGGTKSAPSVDYFDKTKSATVSGFDTFIQILQSRYIKDASQFDWDGVNTNAPEVNYFDISKQYSIIGFHKFATLYDTKYIKDSSQFDWNGINSNAPEVNYFDISKQFTTAGFHKFARLNDSKYIKDSSRFDWNGLRQAAPEVNYFDISKQFTSSGFHKFAALYDTKYIVDSSQFDWDGLRPDAPEVDYFDISKQFTTVGFHKFASKYDTKYIPDASQFDWDGLRQDAPELDYFDISKQYATAGFHKFASLYDTKYIADASTFDWDGLRPDAPEVDYFDISKQFTTVGFHKFASLYDTKYITDSSQFDWNGLRLDAPEVDYFDISKQYATVGFHKFAALYDTKYIADASTFDWDGVRNDAPEVDYFDISKQYATIGFHKFAALYDTKYIADASAFDWDGVRNDAPEVDYFDISKQYATIGFHKFAALYDTKYIAESSQFDWDGTRANAPEVDYFDISKQFTTAGFHKFATIYDTKYIRDSSQFDWDGVRTDAPEVDYFDISKQFTTAGFHRFANLYDSKYILDSSQFDWNGLRPDAPEVDYFDISKQFTTVGFHKFANMYDTKYILGSSRFDWDGVRANAPAVDFFRIPGPNIIPGFTTFFNDVTATKLDDDFSRFSFGGVRNLSPIRNAPYTQFFGFTPRERSGFMVAMTSRNYTLYPIVDPRLNHDATVQIRNLIEGQRAAQRPPMTFADGTLGNYVPALAGLYWFDGYGNNGSATLDRQVPFMIVTRGSSYRGSTWYRKYNREWRNETGGLGYLTTWAQSGRGFQLGLQFNSNQPPLEVQYDKYSLQGESFNPGDPTHPQPYIVRGIQKPGMTKNERWGFGVSFDDGIIRGGAVTHASRIVADVERLFKFTTSWPKGGMFLIRQAGLQLMNPVTDVDPLNFTSRLLLFLPYPSTMQYNPVTSLGSAATSAIGLHMPRHGLLPINTFLNRYELATVNRELNIEYTTSGGNKKSYFRAATSADDGGGMAYLNYSSESNTDFTGAVEGGRSLGYQNRRTNFGKLADPTLGGMGGGYSRLIGLMKELLPNSFNPHDNKDSKRTHDVLKKLSEKDTITRISSLFGGPQSIFGIFGTTIHRAKHPYLTFYTTSPLLYREAPSSFATPLNVATAINQKLPQFAESLKRDTKFAWNHTYADSLKINTPIVVEKSSGTGNISLRQHGGFLNSLMMYLMGDPDIAKPSTETQDGWKKLNDGLPISEFVRISNAVGGGAGGAASRGENSFSGKSVDEETNTYVYDHLGFFRKFPGANLTALTSDNPYNKMVDEQSALYKEYTDDPINKIKNYRTLFYSNLHGKNSPSPRPNDFRRNFEEGEKRLYKKPVIDLSVPDQRTKPYEPGSLEDIYDTNNLTTKYGFGQQGQVGAYKRRLYHINICYDQVNSLTGGKGQETFKYSLPTEKVINGKRFEFRGDRINIIDFKKAKFNINKNSVYEKDISNMKNLVTPADDLIEFYFTGVELSADDKEAAQVIVFRATFDSIQDNFKPSWSPVKYLGRADPLYIYGGFERELSFGFTTHIGSRDELKAVWRKLNYLASWTMPEYRFPASKNTDVHNESPQYMQGPLCRLNIGHLYRKMPGFISSLSYTFDNQTGTWETAGLVEDMDMRNEAPNTDPSIDGITVGVPYFNSFGALQLPKYVQVSISYVPFGVYRPEREGIVYPLYDDSVGLSKDSPQYETGLRPGSWYRVDYFTNNDCWDDNDLEKKEEPKPEAPAPPASEPPATQPPKKPDKTETPSEKKKVPPKRNRKRKTGKGKGGGTTPGGVPGVNGGGSAPSRIPPGVF